MKYYCKTNRHGCAEFNEITKSCDKCFTIFNRLKKNHEEYFCEIKQAFTIPIAILAFVLFCNLLCISDRIVTCIKKKCKCCKKKPISVQNNNFPSYNQAPNSNPGQLNPEINNENVQNTPIMKLPQTKKS